MANLKNTSFAKTEATRKIIRVLDTAPQTVTKSKSQPSPTNTDEAIGQVLAILRQLQGTQEAEIQRNERRVRDDPHTQGVIEDDPRDPSTGFPLARNTPRTLDDLQKWSEARAQADAQARQAFRGIDQSLATQHRVSKAAEDAIRLGNGFDSRETASHGRTPTTWKPIRGISF